MKRLALAALAGVLILVILIVIDLRGDDSEPPMTPLPQDAGRPAASDARLASGDSPAPDPGDPTLPATPPPAADAASGAAPPEGPPTPRALEERYPGFGLAYRDAVSRARAESLIVDQYACASELPADARRFHWRGAETYEVGSDGRAVLRQVEMSYHPIAGQPAEPSEAEQRYLDCMTRKMTGAVSFAAPEGMPGRFQVRSSGTVAPPGALGDDAVARQIERFKRRLENGQLDDAQRAEIQRYLELWQCFAEVGAENRQRCIEE